MRVRLLPWLVAGSTLGGLLAIPLGAPGGRPGIAPGDHAAVAAAVHLRLNRPGEPHHGPRLSFTIR
jgi:hypothetical protein